jgi:CheY-like chemotaxis protein
LVHWHEAEAAERAERLRSFGHDVVVHWQQDGGGDLTRALAAEPPDALVIDLGRLPSHGREVATWLRQKKSLRHVPIVFVPGDEAKTARIRELLPDAVFAPWERLRPALARAIARPVAAPVVPARRLPSGRSSACVPATASSSRVPPATSPMPSANCPRVLGSTGD